MTLDVGGRVPFGQADPLRLSGRPRKFVGG
jgi:hypothetical protein